ncbi:DUF5723 family protein [Emticicia agri]|uniref:DUF5723 domain-containing protein n=1 Tax=Emticicia agri TaxID=2492393 RepID=A0A4Q5M0I3_9BACT|nr:DUF5723 family protein [Emticicia agri]RYU95786.1 hypothetical protein EWM59_10515 [Emticicia agri]
MRLPFCFFLVFIHLQTYSQQWLGISPSNYGGTYGIYTNPANVADSRYKIFLNLAGANIDVINNYAAWGAPYSVLGLVTNTVAARHRADNGSILYRNSYTKESLDNTNSTAFFGADIRGPSLMFTLEKAKMAIGLTTRGRLIANLNNTTTPVARVFVNGTVLPTTYGIPQNDNHFAANLNGYAEMGLTVGKVIREQEEHFLKAGLTVKRVNAVLNLHYIGQEVDFTIDQIANRPRKQNLFFENAVGTYGMTKIGALQIAGFSPNWLFGNAPAGIGYGLDIGFVYEYRPDYNKYDIRVKDGLMMDGTKNKYQYKLSMALLDFGQIRYKSEPFVYQTDVAESNVLISPGTFNKIDSPDKLYNQMNTAFGWTDINYRHQFNVPLPAVIATTFDYAFSERIYLNATWIQSIRGTKSIGMNQPSMIAFIPRWESKWLEVSVPLALQNGYRNLTMGLAGRAGPLFLGTDNLPGLLNIGNPKGLNAYFGLFVPIHRKLPDSPNACYSEIREGWGQGIRDIFKKRKQRRNWSRVR